MAAHASRRRRDGGRRSRRGMSGLLVALAAGAWLAACTTGDVAMNPSVTTETTPVERSLGFYLSEAFETDVREVALRGQGYIAKFPLGQASAALFRNLIPRLSAGAVEVAATRSDAAVPAQAECRLLAENRSSSHRQRSTGNQSPADPSMHSANGLADR